MRAEMTGDLAWLRVDERSPIAKEVGLLAEEYDPRLQRMVGNPARAFSHVALLNTPYNLAHAVKPASQRAR